MSKNIKAFIFATGLLYDIVWRATQSPNGYSKDGVITFLFPFVNTLIIGSWFIRLSTRKIRSNRFYFRVEVVNLDSESATMIARARV